MTNIRALTAEELPLCLPLGEHFFKEAQLPGTWNGDAFLASWQGFYEHGYGLIFGAFEGDDLVGVCGGLIAPDVNTGEKRATELFWWVEAEHRQSSAALPLMQRFERWADHEGCEAVTFAFIHGTGREEVLDRWYRRRGYEPLETHYVRRLN